MNENSEKEYQSLFYDWNPLIHDDSVPLYVDDNEKEQSAMTNFWLITLFINCQNTIVIEIYIFNH